MEEDGELIKKLDPLLSLSVSKASSSATAVIYYLGVFSYLSSKQGIHFIYYDFLAN